MLTCSLCILMRSCFTSQVFLLSSALCMHLLPAYAQPLTRLFAAVRSGAVGITLTSASHVFLMEPVMNPALEAQAIGRSWRMGQLRPVTVHKLYIKDSVEERIMELVAQRVAPGGKPTEGASAMDALRASKGKAKILVSEVRAAQHLLWPHTADACSPDCGRHSRRQAGPSPDRARAALLGACMLRGCVSCACA